MIQVFPPTLASLCYVAHHMREIDRREVFAGRFTEPDALAIDIFTTPGFVDVIWRDDLPVAAVGGREAWPGVWNVWCFGTDAWFDVKLTVTRHIIKSLIPSIIQRGGWRGQCYSHEDHTEAHRWLQWLGFEREGTMRQFGRDGADYHLFAWRVSANVHGRRWRDRQLRAALPTATGRAGPG